MLEWLSRLGENVIPVIAIVFGAVIAMTAIPASFWHKTRRAELEIALKQEMVQRGMSAEEIERVVQAGQAMKDGTPRQATKT